MTGSSGEMDELVHQERLSPNFDERNAPVEIVVLHYTEMLGPDVAIERMCDPQAKVSAHYLIAEDGTVTRLVPEDKRAWHAGVSYWRGHKDINSVSIGIELDHPGHAPRPADCRHRLLCVSARTWGKRAPSRRGAATYEYV